MCPLLFGVIGPVLSGKTCILYNTSGKYLRDKQAAASQIDNMEHGSDLWFWQMGYI